MKRSLGLVATLVLALTPVAVAESSEIEHSASTPGDAEHHRFRHEVALFLGATDEEGHDTEFTEGLEYTYGFAPKLAVGAIVERAGGDLRNTVLVAPVAWNPAGGLWLRAGPGLEYHNGRDGEPEPHFEKSEAAKDEDETYFLFRVGAFYAFHLGERYGIYPSVDLDLVDGEQVWVWGASFGVRF